MTSYRVSGMVGNEINVERNYSSWFVDTCVTFVVFKLIFLFVLDLILAVGFTGLPEDPGKRKGDMRWRCNLNLLLQQSFRSSTKILNIERLFH